MKRSIVYSGKYTIRLACQAEVATQPSCVFWSRRRPPRLAGELASTPRLGGLLAHTAIGCCVSLSAAPVASGTKICMSGGKLQPDEKEAHLPRFTTTSKELIFLVKRAYVK